METLDLMSTAAEISIALAGFAGIITALRDPAEMSRTDVTGLVLIVWMSFVTMFGAMGVMALFALGYSEAAVWRIVSGIFSLLVLIGFTLTIWAMRGRVMRSFRRAPILLFAWAFSLAILILNGMNVLGVVFNHTSAPVILSGFLALMSAALFFVRLLLDSVLKQARKNRRRAEANHGERSTSEDIAD